jgi:hypothetical protein
MQSLIEPKFAGRCICSESAAVAPLWVDFFGIGTSMIQTQPHTIAIAWSLRCEYGYFCVAILASVRAFDRNAKRFLLSHRHQIREKR